MTSANAKMTHASHEPGVALEIVTLWGDASSVLDVTHLAPPRDFVLGDGTESNVDFVVGEGTLPGARHALVRVEDGRVVIVEPSGTRHEVSGDVTRISVGSLVFRVRLVEGERAFAHGAIDRAPARYVAGTAAIAAVFAAIAALTPADAGALVGDRLDTTHPLVAAMMVAPEAFDAPRESASDASATVASAGSDGVAGRPDAPAAPRRRAASGRESGGPATTVTHESVRASGVLGVLQSMQQSLGGDGSTFTGDGAIGRDAETRLGGLLGATLGESAGSFGLVMRGPGRGAGDDPFGTIDTGGLRTRGDRDGDPYGRVHGLCQGPDCRRSAHVTVPTHDVAAMGSISRDAIQRVVRRHIAEIRFCYEQGLESHPDLDGRVATSFVIGPTGAVVAAQVASSSLGHAPTESCIATAVRRWTFPAPTDGGLVRVSYPFSLTASE